LLRQSVGVADCPDASAFPGEVDSGLRRENAASHKAGIRVPKSVTYCESGTFRQPRKVMSQAHDSIIVFLDLNLMGLQTRQRFTSLRIEDAGVPVPIQFATELALDRDRAEAQSRRCERRRLTLIENPF
jgi:hypothetical protein